MRNLSLPLLIATCLSVAPSAAIASDAGVTLVSATVDAPDAGTATPAPVALPDPVADPIEAVSTVAKLWKTGTIPAALIVGLFFALVVASRKIAYLQRGRVAVVIASLIGGLTVLLEAASRGTTPNLAMIGGALIAAVALFLNPTKAAANEKAAEVVA